MQKRLSTTSGRSVTFTPRRRSQQLWAGQRCVLEVITQPIASIVAGEPDIAAFDLDRLLAELSAERDASATFLDSLSPSDLHKTATATCPT